MRGMLFAVGDEPVRCCVAVQLLDGVDRCGPSP